MQYFRKKKRNPWLNHKQTKEHIQEVVPKVPPTGQQWYCIHRCPSKTVSPSVLTLSVSLSWRANERLPPCTAWDRPVPDLQDLLLGRMSRRLPGGRRAWRVRRCPLLRSSEAATSAADVWMWRRDVVYAGRGETRGMRLQGVCVALWTVHTHAVSQTQEKVHTQLPWRGRCLCLSCCVFMALGRRFCSIALAGLSPVFSPSS